LQVISFISPWLVLADERVMGKLKPKVFKHKNILLLIAHPLKLSVVTFTLKRLIL